LVWINFFFEKEDEAVKSLAEIREKFSESAIVWYFTGFIARNRGDIHEAISSFHKAKEFGKDIESLLLTAHYHLGYTYFLTNEYKNSSENLIVFIERAVPKRFKPYSAYQLGFCYWMLGEKEKIPDIYHRVDEWTREHQSYDEFAKKKITYFLENNCFSKFDEIFIPASALLEGRLYKQALRKVEELIPLLKEEKNNRDYYALYYFLKGSIMKGLKKNDRAHDMLLKAVEQEAVVSPNALYAIPYSYVEFAEMELEKNQLDEATAYLNKAKSFKKYDWERLVNVRISSLLQKIDKRKKEQKKNQWI